jgi:hypothetical protein
VWFLLYIGPPHRDGERIEERREGKKKRIWVETSNKKKVS